MEEYFKVLGLKEGATLDEIKDKYFFKVKEYPPEVNGDKFILINNAYEKIISYIKNNNICEEILKEVISINRDISKGDLYIKINRLIDDITIVNFNEMNNKIIDLIIMLKKSNYKEEALFIAIKAEYKFRDIKLKSLADAYRNLEYYLVFK